MHDQERHVRPATELAERLLAAKDGPLTLLGADAEMDRLITAGAADPGCVLADYRAWLVERITRVDAYRAEHAVRPAA